MCEITHKAHTFTQRLLGSLTSLQSSNRYLASIHQNEHKVTLKLVLPVALYPWYALLPPSPLSLYATLWSCPLSLCRIRRLNAMKVISNLYCCLFLKWLRFDVDLSNTLTVKLNLLPVSSAKMTPSPCHRSSKSGSHLIVLVWLA